MQCAPAFNYARDSHMTTIIDDPSILNASQKKVLFESKDLTLDLRYVVEKTSETCRPPSLELAILDLASKGHKGLAVCAPLHLEEGQAVTFILRIPPPGSDQRISQLERKLIAPMGGKTNNHDDPSLTIVKLTRLCW